MGCIFSCFQRNNNGSTETLLFATKYCHICDTHFNNYNNYNKHIVKCSNCDKFNEKFNDSNHRFNNKFNDSNHRFTEKNIEKKNGDL